MSYIDGNGVAHGSTTGTVTLRAHASGYVSSPRGFSADAGVDPTLMIDPAFLSEHPNFSLTTDSVLLGDTAGGVPEPSSWALMLGGFGVAGARYDDAVRRLQPDRHGRY